MLNIKVESVMSLAPVTLRSISGLVSTSNIAIIKKPKHSSSLKPLSDTCCHFTEPACLESLSCLAKSPPQAPCTLPTLSSLSCLSTLSKNSEKSKNYCSDNEKHAYAWASMYGFHI
jgi:hypothetical protein